MNLANKITLARVILVPVFIVLLMASRIPGLSGLVENGTVSKRKFFWIFSVLEFGGLIILTILGWIVLDFVI